MREPITFYCRDTFFYDQHGIKGKEGTNIFAQFYDFRGGLGAAEDFELNFLLFI